MHVVVCYDIVEDRRRNRLMKFLKTYVEHVQKSVFEGDIPERSYEAMRTGMAAIIDKEIDTVRIYHLCGRCTPATEIIGTGRVVEEDDGDIIF